MMKNKISIKFAGFAGFLSVLFLLSSLFVPSLYCEDEEITITTYYPSPHGVYENLEVKNNLNIKTNTNTENLTVNEQTDVNNLTVTGTLDIDCNPDQYLLTDNSGNIRCVDIPPCETNEVLTFNNNNELECNPDLTGSGGINVPDCAADKILAYKGTYDANGNPEFKCVDDQTGGSGTVTGGSCNNCSPGAIKTISINSNGIPTCTCVSGGSGIETTPPDGCASGEVLQGWGTNGVAICVSPGNSNPDKKFPDSCPDGQYLKGWYSNGTANCATLGGTRNCPAGQYATGITINNNGVPFLVCSTPSGTGDGNGNNDTPPQTRHLDCDARGTVSWQRATCPVTSKGPWALIDYHRTSGGAHCESYVDPMTRANYGKCGSYTRCEGTCVEPE